METKVCSRCKQVKAVSDFNFKNRSTGKYMSHCKQCHKTMYYYYRKSDAHKEKYKERGKRSRRQMKQLIKDLKDYPCMDCGGKFPPECMDFDHRDGSQKNGNVSNLIHRVAKTKAFEEIAKCDLVCANCHRIRTNKRRKGDVAPMVERLVETQRPV